MVECSERRQLWERYRSAHTAYAKATDTMDTAQTGNDFNTSYNRAIAARSALERARDEYQRHVAEHNCLGGDQS